MRNIRAKIEELGSLSNLILDHDMVDSIFLAPIDYQNARPYFLLVFRNQDGSTTAAYIERKNIEQIHASLRQFLAVNTWTKVSGFGVRLN